MKKATKFILILLVANTAFAQNPYEGLGKDAEKMGKVLTLSNGLYDEIFDNDSLAQIGSAIYNTISKKVIGFVEYDTLYSEATLEPEVVSRFLSPDPLARQFPFYSPYQFAGNTPIAAIDLDGLESFVATKNEPENIIVLSLVNAEDVLSVTWAKQDMETRTDPLQIIEVQKYVENVKVNKVAGTITLPDERHSNPQTFTYPKGKTDGEGNFVSDPYQGIVKNEISAAIKGSFNVEKGGLILGANNSDADILNKVSRGATLKNDQYDVMEIYVNPSLENDVRGILSTWEDVDMSKVKFMPAPQKGDNNSFELIYKQTSKEVKEIE